jgi:hypothetical protein
MVAPMPTSQPRFNLGNTVMTPGAAAALDEAGQLPAEFLSRHVRGEWGDVDAEDGRANDVACAHEGVEARQERILSSYRTRKNVKIWIITEWDRSVTTLLLPQEY